MGRLEVMWEVGEVSSDACVDIYAVSERMRHPLLYPAPHFPSFPSQSPSPTPTQPQHQNFPRRYHSLLKLSKALKSLPRTCARCWVIRHPLRWTWAPMSSASATRTCRSCMLVVGCNEVLWTSQVVREAVLQDIVRNAFFSAGGRSERGPLQGRKTHLCANTHFSYISARWPPQLSSRLASPAL